MTVEQVWLFWIAFPVKLFLRANIVLLPITYPEAMYKLNGRSLTGVLPIWLERWFTKASYAIADKVITCKNSGSYANWMEADPIIRKKLVVTETLPEAIPTQAFFDELERAKQEMDSAIPGERFNLIYVGRLHPEKSVEDVVRMMAVLRERKIEARLTVIGDGSDKVRLLELTNDLGLEDRIEFLGWKSNAELPHYLVRANAFVSPSAGGALREVALCGLPVITYEMDWIVGLLKNRETFLAVRPHDIVGMADAVEALMADRNLSDNLSLNIRSLALDIWSDRNIATELGKIYG